MITYQGSKQRYAGSIAKAFCEMGSDYYNLDFWDCCCGSGVVSEYLNKPSNMVDMGPWGRFWQAILTHRKEIETELSHADGAASDGAYEYWVRLLAESTVPKEPVIFALSFLALQCEAFNGKPVEIVGTSWRIPGFGKSFRVSKWQAAIRKALRVPIKSVHTTNLNFMTIPSGNVYLDPDYQDTTGYNFRAVDIRSFAYRHKHCNLVISHHAKLPGDWDKVVDISTGGRTWAKDNRELLHIRKRKE